MTGASLRLQKPIPKEVAIVHDAPWEGNTCAYHTVFQDGDLYRMYYRGLHYDEKTEQPTHPEVVCCAESQDGIHWTKPSLGAVEFQGSKANNIIWNGVGAHNFAPFKDSNPSVKPDESYKSLASGEGGLFAFRSPDGVHWTLMNEKPVITEGAFDSQNLAFWDGVRGLYVDYHRGFRDGVRDIMTSTSTDFLTWTQPQWLDITGTPQQHLYTNQILPYFRAPHILVGFPKRFMPDRNAIAHKYPGISDGVFMTSRDGLHFHRWGEAIIRPGLQKERWVNRNNMTAWGIVVTQSDLPGAPDEMSIYSTESYYAGPAVRLRRFTYRMDGFVSVEAPLAGGEMLTRLIDFGSPKSGAPQGQPRALALNVSTSAAGSVRVELQDEKGEVIPGHAASDCDEIYGDSLDRVVTWSGQSDLSDIIQQPIRLRFLLKDADLFAIQVK